MRFDRNLVGVTLRERMRSDGIREQLKMKRIDEHTREYQKKWTQYLEGKDNNRVPELTMNFKPVGLRDLEDQGVAGRNISEFRNGHCCRTLIRKKKKKDWKI
jgi:hypothetical protein